MTRALFTTCGRNILPAPKRSPTTFMPSISGPSITSIGCPPAAAISTRRSSVSPSTYVSMPFTSECVIRSRRGGAPAGGAHPPPLLCSLLDLAGGDVVSLGDLQQALGGVGTPVEHDVL